MVCMNLCLWMPIAASRPVRRADGRRRVDGSPRNVPPPPEGVSGR